MDAFWEAIGWIASAVLVVSLMQTRILRLRIINLIGCLLSIVYNSVVQTWPVVGLNVALALINVVQLWRLKHTRHDPAAYAMTRLDPTDALVSHFLAEHRDDIAKESGPEAVGAAAGADDAFVVLRGDELVGLVAMARGADGAGEVRLDYVTLAYRDTTPGEFVFRRSTALADLGYRSVHAEAGAADYYEAIGFARSKDGFTLSLA